MWFKSLPVFCKILHQGKIYLCVLAQNSSQSDVLSSKQLKAELGTGPFEALSPQHVTDCPKNKQVCNGTTWNVHHLHRTKKVTVNKTSPVALLSNTAQYFFPFFVWETVPSFLLQAKTGFQINHIELTNEAANVKRILRNWMNNFGNYLYICKVVNTF